MNDLNWSIGKKISFRFCFIFILSIIITNNNVFPYFGKISAPIQELLYQWVPWFAKNILHYKYDYAILPNGSGDTSYNWVLLIMLTYFSFLGTIIWSLLDKSRKNYNQCYYWLTVFVRYYIAFILIIYGSYKLIHSQMPPPSLGRLMQPLGEMSPMGLVWTYFGFSKGYNIFIGIVEILGVLLLFRRTVVVGSLIGMAICINIMTANYFFDVPVKILSTTLFLLSLFLTLPYLKNLWGYFILEKPSQLIYIRQPTFKKTWVNKLLLLIKGIFIASYFIFAVLGLLDRRKQIAHYFKKSPLYGIYSIEQTNSQESLPSYWSYIIFDIDGSESIRDNYYKREYVQVGIDTTTKKIVINKKDYNYSVAHNGDIILSKLKDGKQIEIKLKKKDIKAFELMNRDFNWIQEYPYNR